MSDEQFTLKTISVKNLASMALTDFCPRCFWIKSRIKFNSPWSIFPSIFSNIDSFSKQATGIHIASRQIPPSALMKFGQLTNRMTVPHWSKFSYADPNSGIILRGAPDEIFRVNDNTLAIFDYKTARQPKEKDEMMPLYQAQLGGYRWLALKTGMGETSLTALIYYDPQTTPTTESLTEDGFKMEFKAIIHRVETKLEDVECYLMEAKRISEMPVAPHGIKNCKDCEIVKAIAEKITAE